MFTCPVCFYSGMTEPPQDYNICECCGTEFGYSDEYRTHKDLRDDWLRSGAKWFFGEPPIGWNPWRQAQVIKASLSETRYVVTVADSSPTYTVILSPTAVRRGVYATAEGAIDVFTEITERLYLPPNPKGGLCPIY